MFQEKRIRQKTLFPIFFHEYDKKSIQHYMSDCKMGFSQAPLPTHLTRLYYCPIHYNTLIYSPARWASRRPLPRRATSGRSRCFRTGGAPCTAAGPLETRLCPTRSAACAPKGEALFVFLGERSTRRMLEEQNGGHIGAAK